MEFDVGSILEGKVTGITKFGAFVSLPGGKSGLVHISEISYSYVNDVNEVLKEGQDVKVKVIGIDENGRINLSIKKAAAPPPRNLSPDARRAPGGTRAGSAPSRPARQRETITFEERLKQFMQSADSKLSELRNMDKRGTSRRGRKS